MSKHRDRQFYIARSMFGLVAALLVGLVVWIAVRAGGPASAADDPVIVQPSANLQAVESTTAPTADPAWPTLAGGVPSPSASSSGAAAAPPTSGSASPSAGPSQTSASASAPGSPKPSKTSKSPKPTATKTTTAPAAANDLSATYSTTASWRGGFIAAVRVTNNGSEAHDFTITVSYPSGSGLSVGGTWNGSASASGNTITVHGNSLAAGRSITVGFQAGADSKSQVKATGCTIGGGSCRVS